MSDRVRPPPVAKGPGNSLKGPSDIFREDMFQLGYGCDKGYGHF